MPATPLSYVPQAEDLQRMAALRRIQEMGEHNAEPIFDVDDGFVRAWRMTDLKNRPAPKWLIENIVEEEGLTVFFGPDKVGKTAALSSLLWGWAAGMKWWLMPQYEMHDPRDDTERRVMYILLEGQAAYYERFEAWKSRYSDESLDLDNFIVVDESMILYDRNVRLDAPSTWTTSMQRIHKTVAVYQPHILVIDTLSRATPGMDENSPQMAAIVGFFDMLRDAYGTAIIVVHHTSLSEEERPRGHSSLKGAASSYVRIKGKPEDDVLYLVNGPHRNAEPSQPQAFQRVSYDKAFVIQATSNKADGMTKQRRAILTTLAQHGGEMPLSKLHDALGSMSKSQIVTRKNVQNMTPMNWAEYKDGVVRLLEDAPAMEPEDL